MIEQKLKPRIKHEWLNKLEIVGSPEVIEALNFYFNRVGRDLGFNIFDITVTLGISEPNELPMEKIKNIKIYMNMPESPEKDKFKNDNKIDEEFISDYKNLLEEKQKKFKEIPQKLINYWLNTETNQGLEELYKIISLAVGYDIEIIKATDYTILAEILIRIFLKPESSIDQAFFLRLALNLWKTFMDSLNITLIEKLNGLIK